MTEIVPAIIAKDNAELNAKIAFVKKDAKRIQLDIMDGKFVKNKTVMPKDIKLKGKIGIEFHLMVYYPEKYLEDCFKIKPKDSLAQIVGRGQQMEAKALVRAIQLCLRNRLYIHWGVVHNV